MEGQARGQAAIEASDYYRVFSFNPHPMWVFDLDTLELLDVNDAAVRHYGYSRQEFLGMTIRDLRPADDIPRLVRHLPTTRENPVPPTTLWRHVKKDGSLIDVEITSFRVGFGGRAAKLVTVNDVTGRRNATEAVRLLAMLVDKLREIGRAPSVTAARELATALRLRVSEALEGFPRNAKLPAGTGRAETPEDSKRLSGREHEVLERIAQGHTNREVAGALGLSVKSVEAYRARLRSKLGLHSRAELVRYALDRGLLGPER